MTDDVLAALPDEFDWERESPAIHLSEAFAAVLEMLDPHGPRGPLAGPYHRLRWARISVMFSAFAAEGFINRMLMARLSGSDFDAVENIPTIAKYAVGPRLALGKDLFERGREPLQTLTELFSLRNRLAHPKPRSERISKDEFFAGPEADTYSPTRAVRYMTAVAEAAAALDAAKGAPEQIAPYLVVMRPQLLDRAKEAELLPRPTYDDYRAAFTRTFVDDR